MSTIVSKVCCACGIDVSQAKRVKDSAGNYYCHPCWSHVAHQHQATSATSTPVLAGPPVAAPVTSVAEHLSYPPESEPAQPIEHNFCVNDAVAPEADIDLAPLYEPPAASTHPRLQVPPAASANVRPLSYSAHEVTPAPLQFDAPVWVRGIDGFLMLLGRTLSMSFFTANARGLFVIGNWAVVGMVLLLAIVSLWMSINSGSMEYFSIGVGYAMATLLVQYVTIKAIDAGNRIIDSSPSELSPTAFLKCCALFCTVLGLLIFSLAIVTAIRTRSVEPIWPGLGSAIFFCYLTSLSLNPQLLSVRIQDQGNAGLEAIGIFSFALKAWLRIAPIQYGTWAAIALLQLCDWIFNYASSNKDRYDTGIAAVRLVPILFTLAMALLLPVISYLLFLLYHLLVDVVRSVLILPRLLNGVAGSRDGVTDATT